mmetsp:Transcript_6429/g.9469  ORF Transcript_6429/g.9469 Transcript_6429/m.9469 type:complete len:111 (-) Transcript_6429:341-673(-)
MLKIFSGLGSARVNAVNEAIDNAKDKAEDAEDKAEGAVDEAGDAAAAIKEKAEDAIEEAKNQIEDLKDKLEGESFWLRMKLCLSKHLMCCLSEDEPSKMGALADVTELIV